MHIHVYIYIYIYRESAVPRNDGPLIVYKCWFLSSLVYLWVWLPPAMLQAALAMGLALAWRTPLTAMMMRLLLVSPALVSQLLAGCWETEGWLLKDVHSNLLGVWGVGWGADEERSCTDTFSPTSTGQDVYPSGGQNHQQASSHSSKVCQTH